MISNGEIPKYTFTARLGQDLNIPLGPVDVYDESNALVSSINLSPSVVSIVSEENAINWTSVSGNIVADGSNCKLFVSKTALAAFGKVTINATMFVQEASNQLEPYCDIEIKIG
jgi:DUF4097 and DUF4098 domain-containing protein YvlB